MSIGREHGKSNCTVGARVLIVIACEKTLERLKSSSNVRRTKAIHILVPTATPSALATRGSADGADERA